MEHLLIPEQEEIRDKLEGWLGTKNIEKEIVGFNYWFNEVKLIDPSKLNHEQAQGFADRLLNTNEGKLYFELLNIKFYHIWHGTARVAFLALTQSELYYRDIKTNWYLWWNFNAQRYIVTKRIKE